MYEKIILQSDKPVDDLAEEFFRKILENEPPSIIRNVDLKSLQRSIRRNFRKSAEYLGYPSQGRKQEGQSPCLR